jgi:hypothetical protein
MARALAHPASMIRWVHLRNHAPAVVTHAQNAKKLGGIKRKYEVVLPDSTSILPSR